MSDSLLKKEFKSSDLNRIRNIVNKDFTKATSLHSGYVKSATLRKEGDIWEEDGRTWIIVKGIKQNITKLDSAREAVKIPLVCPKCSKSMNHHLDKKMYKIHKFCFNCTLEYEAELRRLGLYKQYENIMIKRGFAAFASELEQMISEFSQSSKSSTTYIAENGDVENWDFNSTALKDKKLEKLNEFLQYINSNS